MVAGGERDVQRLAGLEVEPLPQRLRLRAPRRTPDSREIVLGVLVADHAVVPWRVDHHFLAAPDLHQQRRIAVDMERGDAAGRGDEQVQLGIAEVTVLAGRSDQSRHFRFEHAEQRLERGMGLRLAHHDVRIDVAQLLQRLLQGLFRPMLAMRPVQVVRQAEAPVGVEDLLGRQLRDHLREVLQRQRRVVDQRVVEDERLPVQQAPQGCIVKPLQSACAHPLFPPETVGPPCPRSLLSPTAFRLAGGQGIGGRPPTARRRRVPRSGSGPPGRGRTRRSCRRRSCRCRRPS